MSDMITAQCGGHEARVTSRPWMFGDTGQHIKDATRFPAGLSEEKSMNKPAS
jgi:hypothetical protein